MEENNTQPQPIEEKKGINPLFILGGLVVVAAVAGVIVFGGKKQPQVEALNTQVQPQTQAETQVAPSGPVKEFTVNGGNYAFDPATITVNKGDTVKIKFVDGDGRHNLIVDGYNVATNIVGEGGTDTVTFVADKVGSFEYYCSVANHRDLGMTGTLLVK